MNHNVIKVIHKCQEANEGEIFLSLKPRLEDFSTTVAHLYSAGGELCHFNMPDGKNFKIWDREYEKYSYGELEFVPGKGFDYLFANWDNMIKTCNNRACEADISMKLGKICSKHPKNRYERMRENRIAAYNSMLGGGLLAVIDMEYSVDKTKLDDIGITKNPKADLICVALENDRITFFITEYKSTRDGFGVSLEEHYDDMTMYRNDIRIKEHLIRTLQERVKYRLVTCDEKVEDSINTITPKDIDVELLFLFSDSVEYRTEKVNVLHRGYKYIFEKSNADGVPVRYASITKIEESCLRVSILKKFEYEGKFELDSN